MPPSHTNAKTLKSGTARGSTKKSTLSSTSQNSTTKTSTRVPIRTSSVISGRDTRRPHRGIDNTTQRTYDEELVVSNDTVVLTSDAVTNLCISDVGVSSSLDSTDLSTDLYKTDIYGFVDTHSNVARNMIPSPSPPSTPTSNTVTPVLAHVPTSSHSDDEFGSSKSRLHNITNSSISDTRKIHTESPASNIGMKDLGGHINATSNTPPATTLGGTCAPLHIHNISSSTGNAIETRAEEKQTKPVHDNVYANSNEIQRGHTPAANSPVKQPSSTERNAHQSESTKQDAGNTVKTGTERDHISRTLEHKHERELFMKIRLLHMWASQDVRYFMQNIATCVCDGHLIAHRCQKCVTLYMAYRKILSMPFFERNENAARAVVVNCFLGFADACSSTCVTSKARQRLMKRVDNGISGALARVVRTSAEVEYTESLRSWYSVVHTNPKASPHHSQTAQTHPTLHKRHKHHGSHKGRHEDEHGYRRRTFFDLLDIITLDLSETGAAGLIGILYQSGGDVDKLPPLYLAIVRSMRQTVADSFYNLRYERERTKAQRRYAKMPWKTLITITRYSGKRLSSVLLHIVFRLSFGDDTLLSLWIEWVLGVQDLEEELNHMREYAGIDPRILRKCEDIVDKHYPFNAEKFSSRQNLSDLLISNLGEPALECEFVDGLSEQMFGTIYAYLNLLVDFRDGTDVRKKLLDDKRVIRFATEMLGFAESLFIDLIVHGNMCDLLSELHDLLKPLLKSERSVCKGEKLESFRYLCETAAEKLLRCVFRFIHSAVIHGKQVQRVLVWVLDSFGRCQVAPESCEELEYKRRGSGVSKQSNTTSSKQHRHTHRKQPSKKASGIPSTPTSSTTSKGTEVYAEGGVQANTQDHTRASADTKTDAQDAGVLNLEAMVERTFPGTQERAALEQDVAELIDYYKYSRKTGEPPRLESFQKLVTPLRQWYMSRVLTL